MKKSAVIFFLMCCLLSCQEPEKTGLCLACCDANGHQICKPKFTQKMCAEYNKNKVDGFNWTFSEGFPYCVRPASQAVA